MLPYLNGLVFGSLATDECIDLVVNHLGTALLMPDFDLERVIAGRISLLYLDDFQIELWKIWLKLLELRFNFRKKTILPKIRQ